MLNRPRQLLHGDEYLTEHCVDLRLARIETRYTGDRLLIVEYEPVQHSGVSLTTSSLRKQLPRTSASFSTPAAAA